MGVAIAAKVDDVVANVPIARARGSRNVDFMSLKLLQLIDHAQTEGNMGRQETIVRIYQALKNRARLIHRDAA